MIISFDATEQDEKRLLELKVLTEASTRSNVIRDAIRFYHKKILQESLTTVNGSNSIDTPVDVR